eukprot:CAMPEP_0113494922 /NCGR_PEP_ID=MMETSP0014_2-20120614/29350_1 /TAXON_ID=2857 /ORGANISM="Nitzschia sp." /LENGTH=862 /DNA_ID=CAMNT_0000388817 /DNA_START=294 /DNA_END=2879 /DNA_ORIENTATION=- /assembly_acc=CAM_ASM_000159
MNTSTTGRMMSITSEHHSGHDHHPRDLSHHASRTASLVADEHQHHHHHQQQEQQPEPLQLGFSLSHLRTTLSALKEAVDDHDYHSARRATATSTTVAAAAGDGGGHRRHRRERRRRRQRLQQQRRRRIQQRLRQRQQQRLQRARSQTAANDDDDGVLDDDDHRQQTEVNNRDVEFFEADTDDEEEEGFELEDEDDDDEEEEDDDGIDVDPVDVHEQVTSTTEALQDAAIAIAKASMVSIMSLTLKEKERHIRQQQVLRHDHHHHESRDSAAAWSEISRICRLNAILPPPPPPAVLTLKRRDVAYSSSSRSSSFLLQLPWKQRHGMMHDLREIFDAVIHTRRAQTVEFYKLWREWVLQLLSADHCRELQLFGWEQLEELVKASAKHRPPPRTYVVEGAGVDFVNGEYHYSGKLTPDGYAYTSSSSSSSAAALGSWSSGVGGRNDDLFDPLLLDNDLAMDDPTAPHYASTLAALSSACSRHSYERVTHVPRPRDGEDDNGTTEDVNEEEDTEEKKITLFQCTMQSKQKWWFLSEADEEQPGTDRDIDYYEHSRSWRASASRQHNGRPTNAAAAAARQRMLRRLADEDVSAYGDVQYQDDLPPTQYWRTSKDGVGPAPSLKQVGYMVPRGEETNTLEHQLAQWMLREDVLNLAINQSKHCEQVANHYLPLVMKFSATVFELECGEGGFTSSSAKGTQLIVQLSHWVLMRNESFNDSDDCGFGPRQMQKRLSSSSLSTNSTRSETSFSSTRMQDDDDEFIVMMNQCIGDSLSNTDTTVSNGEVQPLDHESIRRMNIISDWLSDDVLLYPKDEDSQHYARIFMNVGLDSVDAIMQDLKVEDLESMEEFKQIKTFHKRRIRQYLLERT